MDDSRSNRSRVLVIHAAPQDFAPGTIPILCRLGYTLVEPEAWALLR